MSGGKGKKRRKGEGERAGGEDRRFLIQTARPPTCMARSRTHALALLPARAHRVPGERRSPLRVIGRRARHLVGVLAPAFFRSSALPLLLASLLFAGCLPSSNQRKLKRALFPSDSLSRQIAEATPVDTLQLVRRVDAPPEAILEYPTSLGLLADGRIVVAETQRGALVTFDVQGGYERALQYEGFSYPFLAGTKGDTVAVLNRGAHRVDYVVGDDVVHAVAVPEARNGNALLTSDGLYYKTAVEGEGTTLYRFDDAGAEQDRWTLQGPYWRHLGFLRSWSEQVLALSGYRPVVDVLAPYTPSGSTLDTLALVGFDSPQLERSRLWAAGDVDEPPLLTPAAAALDDRLFVLNARPGWLRIDVYARGEGGLRLQRILLQPNPTMDNQLLYVDLAARRVPGGVEFVALTTKPRPGFAFYFWPDTLAAQG